MIIPNQLQSITDSTTSDAGLKHGTWNYTYDGNGNLIIDPSKGTTGITYSYNMLNLPQTVTGSKTITYTYRADGQKLRRVSTTTTGGTGITDYINGIQYDDNNTSTETLSFIQTEEGKAVPTSGGSYNYTYYLGDNLGNTRVTFDTQTGSAAIVQADNYYPFGMEQSVTANGTKNEYLYNRKELQEEIGIYDYGARGYDAVLGRWNSIDPLAEKSRRFSNYVYGDDDPIRNIDPDGMETEESEKKRHKPEVKKVNGDPKKQPMPEKIVENKKNSSSIVTTITKALDYLEKIMKGSSKNETPGGFVITMTNGTGNPGGKAKNLSAKDHINLDNVLDPLGALTPDDKTFTLMLSYATDVISNSTTVSEVIKKENAVAPSTKVRESGFVILPNSNDTVRQTNSTSQNGATVLFVKPNGQLTVTPDQK